MSKSTPDASPAYKGRSSSVICHDPRLNVIGGTGVDDLQSNIQFIVQIINGGIFMYKGYIRKL